MRDSVRLSGEALQAAFSHDPIQRHVPAIRLQASDALAFVSDADELGSPPSTTFAQVLQAAIVEPRAAAE